ncbi:aspartate aminotransferase family protein [Comamonas flocculans]|uniref:Acetylornithine aminotransferase n=1 Tax=Comamonas flocculans TaxID=2597701 RepID=A0A5B8S0X0_9BURK|nr:aspartate aminotransferase family protein [Comamonas flocculans]QEA14395.1 aspartate aminotransferase family protein [Comamonas flocculans]
MNAPTAAMASHVMNTYNRVPIALERGKGVRVWDINGKEYLDALAGIAVSTLGHDHPRLVPALQEQLARLIHCSNYYQVPGQERLAALLCERAHMDKVFFCSTGLEANEAAIKIALKHGVDRGVQRPRIVVYEHAFHGRSIATMAATANSKVRDGFGALPDWFVRVPVDDIAALEAAAAQHPDIVAVLMEPIQGEGGLHPVDPAYMQQVRKLCNAKGWLMMLDEIQCGMGRTGKWFAHQWADIVPDVMSMAKGLASGVPVGAVLARGAAAEVLQPGNHGTTFGGNPLAMRAGVETITIMEEDGLLANASAVGEYLRARLGEALADIKAVTQVRGRGLMIGVELDRPCGALIGMAAQAGLLISVTADRVIRIVPPLILTRAEADEIVARLNPVVRNFLSQ